MAKIIKLYPENVDKKTSYKLMNSNIIKKMQNAEGSELELVAYVLYDDDDKRVLSIMTIDNEIFATISETFINAFMDMVDHFGEELTTIKVLGRDSKNGRHYITCDIV